MIYLSALAVRAATAVDGEPAAAAADLRARAWAELANAHRVAGDLAAAEAAMARAVDEREAGTGALLLLARIADLAGSLCGARRRFLDAFRLLDIAHELYRRQGEIHAAGRVLIAKGLYAGYSGDADEGIQLLVRGLESIDRDREPKLAFQALHNLLLFWVDLGLYDQALRHLRQMRPLYKRYAGPVERVKLRWVEGKIAAGLGDLRRAEAAFLRARNEYAAAGLGFRAALTALDLAAVWLRQGRTAELQPLVGEMLAAFRAAGAGREALAAVLLLHEAVERQQATLELLDRIAATLGRIERQRAPQPAPDVA